MNITHIDPVQLAHVFEYEARLMNEVANAEQTSIHGVYLMTHNSDFQLSIMDAGIKRHHKTGAKVLYCGEEPASGYLGGDAWTQYLELNTEPHFLVPVYGARYVSKEKNSWMINSFTEARPAIEKALELGMENIEVIALPFHIQRCFAGFATEILNMGSCLNVFARVSEHISFTGMIRHSQGIQKKTPGKFSEEDIIKKLLVYPNLASPSEILHYMDERDLRIRSTRKHE